MAIDSIEQLKEVAGGVFVSGQPTPSLLPELAEQGFRTVINIRRAGETDMPLDLEAERAAVEAAGLIYRWVPVALDPFDFETADRVSSELEEAAKPVLLHCKLGKRAGTLGMMWEAKRNGLDGDAAAQRAAKIGVDLGNQHHHECLRRYADAHANQH